MYVRCNIDVVSNYPGTMTSLGSSGSLPSQSVVEIRTLRLYLLYSVKQIPDIRVRNQCTTIALLTFVSTARFVVRILSTICKSPTDSLHSWSKLLSVSRPNCFRGPRMCQEAKIFPVVRKFSVCACQAFLAHGKTYLKPVRAVPRKGGVVSKGAIRAPRPTHR